MKDSTEIRDSEITEAFTNLIETLNLSGSECSVEMKIHIFCHDHGVMNVVAIGETFIFIIMTRGT